MSCSEYTIYDQSLQELLLEDYRTQKVFNNFHLLAQFSTLDNFGYSSYILDVQHGPKLLFHHMPHIHDDKQAYLQKLGVMNMVATSMAHSFQEGIFELPAPDFHESKMLVISMRVINDDRTSDYEKNYTIFQINILVPLEIMRALPSPSAYEDELLLMLKGYIHSTHDIPTDGSLIQQLILSVLMKKLTY